MMVRGQGEVAWLAAAKVLSTAEYASAQSTAQAEWQLYAPSNFTVTGFSEFILVEWQVWSGNVMCFEIQYNTYGTENGATSWYTYGNYRIHRGAAGSTYYFRVRSIHYDADNNTVVATAWTDWASASVGAAGSGAGASAHVVGGLEAEFDFWRSQHVVEDTGSDADSVTFTPSVLADWDGNADPGDLDDALNQLAERIDDLEGTPQGYVWHTFVFTRAGIVTEAEGTLAMCVPGDFTIDHVYLHLTTAPTGQSLIVDIHKNGTTIFTNQANRPEVAAGATTATSGTPDVTSLALNDELTFEIDQTGSLVAGSDLTVHVRCKQDVAV